MILPLPDDCGDPFASIDVERDVCGTLWLTEYVGERITMISLPVECAAALCAAIMREARA